MAEAIFFEVAVSITKKLGDLARQELKLIWGVNDELKNLENSVSKIKNVLIDAEERAVLSGEEKQSERDAVNEWISRLKDAFYDVDDLLDEFSYEKLRRKVMMNNSLVRIFFSRSNQLTFRFRMGHRVKEISEILDVINTEKNEFNFAEKDARDNKLKKRRETHSYIPKKEVIGRDDDERKIIDFLLDTNSGAGISVIAIVGMGGLGKTALAQIVYNHEEITKHFELKLWVCISEEFDVKMIVERIIESATGNKPESLQLDSLQKHLRKKIDGKKYLLMMDDVWNEDREKWISLKRLLMGGAKGSKIVVTTRSERVAKTSEATKVYPLGYLSAENSWELFQQMAFAGKEMSEDSNLIKIGKEIVQVLKGVPLAIRTVGSLLYFKELEDEWLSFKNNELGRIMFGEKDGMQPILMLSYKDLPYNLKRCFTYCAMFPKDDIIYIDKLIRQWMAQGFVQLGDGMDKPIEDVGHDCFMELLWRSFFQEITYRNEWGDIVSCKMHDLMHDLACSIVGNECIVASLDTSSIDQRTRHISFTAEEKEKLELPEWLFEVKNVRTFKLEYYYHDPDLCYNKFIFDKLISKFLQLRTLNMRYCGIKELPEFIGKLIHLRYLDLSGNDSMTSLPYSITYLYNLETLILHSCGSLKELPEFIGKLTHLRYLDLSRILKMTSLPSSITDLYNLETLILRLCLSLRELPRDTKNLINLRHLDIFGCNVLTCMPKGLSRLTGLQTLNQFVVGKDDDRGLSELKGLPNLKGSLYIRGLKFCRIIDSSDNYLKTKKGLLELELSWGNDDDLHDHESVLKCLQPHHNLRKLHVNGYQGVRLSDWLSFDHYVHLVEIKLSSCKWLQHLPPFEKLSSLKYLHLENLPCVEYIDNNDSFSYSSVFFPFLEKLRLYEMPNLKRLWKGESMEIKNSKDLELSCIDGEQQFIGEEEHEASILLWKKLGNLRNLCLLKIPKLVYLPKGLQHVTTLETLEINYCENLQSLPEWIVNLISLKRLVIGCCPKLTSLPQGMCHLTSLRSLGISGSVSTSLLEDICHLTLLSDLAIWECTDLTSLPECICHLTSLSDLTIYGCVNLSCLPEGMGDLQSLRSLTIRNCPKLEERCKGGGEDWPKISNVPVKAIGRSEELKIQDYPSVHGEEDVGVFHSLVRRILQCCLPS